MIRATLRDARAGLLWRACSAARVRNADGAVRWRSAANDEGQLEGLPERDELEVDVAVVGAGPAGLAAAIRLKQLCAQRGDTDLSVCVLEKGAEVGAHILSGNVFEPRALDELLPDWRSDESRPHMTPVTSDRFELLTPGRAWRLPTPPQMHNTGNFIVSLSQLVRWLGSKAEELGVDIFPSFAASGLLVENGRVRGVVTRDMGIAKDGSRKPTFTRGAAIRARLTLLAEGARGSLTKEAERIFDLRAGREPQTYALGLKEVWRVLPGQHRPGEVLHTIGWPLDMQTYGGSFMYHMEDEPDGHGEKHRVATGFVVALDYRNPHLNTFGELQKWKTHPAIRRVLEGGECLQYGARTLNEGGLQSIPRLAFPGGAIVGCAAGFLNVPKIKGTHTAMKSGMLAAEAAFDSFVESASDDEFDVTAAAGTAYESAIEASWVYDELRTVRNIRPGFKYGLLPGLAYGALDTYILRGRAPWTLSHAEPDHATLEPASESKPIEYPKPDGKVVLDVLTAVSLSGTTHDHDEPAHLKLSDDSVPEKINLPVYDGPEGRYCPARVYEYVDDDSEGVDGVASRSAVQKLVINAQNCVHCKACDIKDPTQNINWTVPEGGDGPKYTMM